MEKWICKVCGYTHQGATAPEICPQCGATKVQFYRKIEDGRQGCGLSIIAAIIFLTTAISIFYSCHSSLSVDKSAVTTFDLNRYMGKWYEIARFDHRFERDMTHCTAVYTMQKNGTVKVVNRGYRNDDWRISNGKAKRTSKPGVLRVSFFGPFYSDYRVLMVASDYSYALIGGSNDDYLWILSRTPRLDEDTRNRILFEAQRRGYQTDKLIWVDHGE